AALPIFPPPVAEKPRRPARPRPPTPGRPPHEPPPPRPADAGQRPAGPAAGPAAAAAAAAAAAPVLAGAGGGVLGDGGARARRPGLRLPGRRARRPGLRRHPRRAGAAAGGDDLHPAALPRPGALLPAVAAGAGDRRLAAQRPRGQRRDAPDAGRAAAAVGVLVLAAAGHGAVGAAVRAARRA